MQISIVGMFDANRRAAPAAKTLQHAASKSGINQTNIVLQSDAAIRMEQRLFLKG